MCTKLRNALNRRTLAYTTHCVDDLNKIPSNTQIGCLVIALEPTESVITALENCEYVWFITIVSLKEYQAKQT